MMMKFGFFEAALPVFDLRGLVQPGIAIAAAPRPRTLTNCRRFIPDFME
jgi:hypothetical protein